jgi:hypothetical protein
MAGIIPARAGASTFGVLGARAERGYSEKALQKPEGPLRSSQR